jgi:hypothetical protein
MRREVLFYTPCFRSLYAKIFKWRTLTSSWQVSWPTGVLVGIHSVLLQRVFSSEVDGNTGQVSTGCLTVPTVRSVFTRVWLAKQQAAFCAVRMYYH